MKKNIKYKRQIQKILMTFAFPVGIYLVMEALCLAFMDTHMITSTLEITNVIRNTCIMTCAAFALSMNMSCGRMDLSLGAQQMVACIIGGNIALSLGFSAVGVMLTCMVSGMLAGLFVGGLFIITRVPSMVLGIGMALVYECICFAYDYNGFQLYGKPDMVILGDYQFQTLVVVLVIIGFFILFDYSKFGYHYRSIRGSQTVAISMGINVFTNCLFSYAIAGAMTGLAGVFSTSYEGILSSEMGLASTGAAFTALFPIFIANFLSNYINRSFAMFFGALTVTIISYGLNILSLPSPAVTVVNYVCLLLFLLSQGVNRQLKKKKAFALRKEESLQLAAMA